MQTIKSILLLIILTSLFGCLSQTTPTNNSIPNQTQLIQLSKDYGHSGKQHAKVNRYEKALIATRKAIFKAQEANALAWLIVWRWQLGSIFVSQGKTDEAIQAFEQALHGLVPCKAFGWDMSKHSKLSNISFYQKFRPLFFKLADLYQQRATQDDLEKAIKVIEKLKTAAIASYFGDCVTPSFKKSFSDIDASGTAVIYPISFANRLELLVKFPHNIQQLTVPIAHSKVANAIQQFQRTLQIGRNNSKNTDYLIYAQQLYQWLLEPLRNTLEQQKIKTLVFVPEGILNMLPMAALHDGKQFLIEQYAVAITPSLNLTDLSTEPLSAKKLVLISGLTEAAHDYPKLYYAEQEANAINKIYPNATNLLNEQFTTEKFDKVLEQSDYNIVHIISHAEFARNVKDSFIVTSGRDKLKFTDESDINNSAIFLKNRQTQLELFSLSACNTAKGDNEWAALGLSGIAIQAGARSSLATLWKAHDRVTYHLIKDFYTQFAKSKSKAESLQFAQQEVLLSRFHHPFYWAGLVLIGNWL